MSRKRITQALPFLLPLRVAQRKAFFYAGMRLDGKAYAKTILGQRLPHRLFSADNGLYNKNTGFDMVYQENKVYNLKLAAKTLDGLLIRPGETFSLWKSMRRADSRAPYKDGLNVINGRLCATYGGGLCQISNLLFWVFLHSPLTVVERHTHKVKDFPTMRSAEPEGVDATIREGWLDLKLKNETDAAFQIGISFSDEYVTGSLYTDRALPFQYEIRGDELAYFREGSRVFQKTSIYRREVEPDTREVLSERLLYQNVCEIGYSLPDGTEIAEIG
jgi:vancomycin resistance protein VanW